MNATHQGCEIEHEALSKHQEGGLTRPSGRLRVQLVCQDLALPFDSAWWHRRNGVCFCRGLCPGKNEWTEMDDRYHHSSICHQQYLPVVDLWQQLWEVEIFPVNKSLNWLLDSGCNQNLFLCHSKQTLHQRQVKRNSRKLRIIQSRARRRVISVT